jgi:hypothetical protein
MKKLKIAVNLLILVAVFATPANAQLKKLAQTGLQFLKIDAGARAASMAGAMTNAGYDANAQFYNPAGIARMEYGADVLLNNTQWIADISYNSFAAAYTLEDIGTFGIHGLFTDYGDDIIGTQVAANENGYIETGNVDVSGYAFGISYGRNLSDRFSIGGTVKFIGQSLGSNVMLDGSVKENKVSGVAFDFGTIFYPGWESFRFGMSVRNFGAELKYEKEAFEAPLTFTIGAAFDFLDMFEVSEGQNLLVSVDLVHPRDYTERVHMGAEYIFMDIVAFRAGYKTNYDNEGLTFGAGLFYEVSGVNIKIDYSYNDMEYFSGVNRFTVGFSF